MGANCSASREFFAPDYLADVHLVVQDTNGGAGDKGQAQQKMTLLDKLGGKEAVDAIVRQG